MAKSPNSESTVHGRLIGGAFFTGLIVLGVMIALIAGFLRLSGTPEVQTGVLIVLAVCVLVFLLFIVTSGFRALGLSDSTQALGLPAGSVRAFIALMLIMIFVIVSVYAVRTVGEGVYNYVGVVSREEAYGLASNDDDDYVIREIRGGDKNGMYEVWQLRGLAVEGTRLAQQLLTTLATLVVAISAFYFGTHSVETAVQAARVASGDSSTDVPLIRDITPSSGKSGGLIETTVTGRNLSAPKSVTLVRGSKTIAAMDVLSSDSIIQCKFQLEDPVGKWTLAVENVHGEKDSLEDAFEIT